MIKQSLLEIILTHRPDIILMNIEDLRTICNDPDVSDTETDFGTIHLTYYDTLITDVPFLKQGECVYFENDKLKELVCRL